MWCINVDQDDLFLAQQMLLLMRVERLINIQKEEERSKRVEVKKILIYKI